MAGKEFIIGADLLYDGKTKLPLRSIVVQGNEIVEVSKKRQNQCIGNCYPCIYRPHSHIGMDRQGTALTG